MKKLTLLLMLSTSILFAQQKPIQKLTAGDELIKAKKHFYTGSIIAITGIGLSALLAPNSSDDAGIKGGLFLTGIISAVGTIMVFESFSHIGKAGRLLNENKSIVLGFNPTGASLVYRF